MNCKFKNLKDVYVEPFYVYGHDDDYSYIIDGKLKKVIYTTKYEQGYLPQPEFAGKTENGPAFFDSRYSTYIYPCNDGYRVTEDIVLVPVRVNDINVINVTQGEFGIGVEDSLGKKILENCHDEIEIELKVILKKGNSVTEKTIPLFQNNFEKVELWITYFLQNHSDFLMQIHSTELQAGWMIFPFFEKCCLTFL